MALNNERLIVFQILLISEQNEQAVEIPNKKQIIDNSKSIFETSEKRKIQTEIRNLPGRSWSDLSKIIWRTLQRSCQDILKSFFVIKISCNNLYFNEIKLRFFMNYLIIYRGSKKTLNLISIPKMKYFQVNKTRYLFFFFEFFQREFLKFKV